MNRVSVLFSVLLTCLLLAQSSHGEEPVLNIYNWADYIGETTIADFEKEYGIKVNYDVYDSSPTVDAKLMAGRSGYDVVVHSATYASRMVQAGFYQEIDRSRLSNWHNLDEKLLAIFEPYDPGNRHGLPYMWGTTGFAYNEEMILARMPDAPVDSAAMMFDPAVVSKFADCGVSMLEAPLDVIPGALLYLGREPNSMEAADLKAAVEVLQGIRPYIKYYSGTKFLLDMPAGELCLAGSWSGDYAVATSRAREAGIDIKLRYVVPKEGSTFWFDALYLPSDAPHPNNAHLFLDYLLRPQVIADITDATGYANANRAATALVKKEYSEDLAIYPDEAIMQRVFSGIMHEPKVERRRTRAWTRAKSGL